MTSLRGTATAAPTARLRGSRGREILYIVLGGAGSICPKPQTSAASWLRPPMAQLTLGTKYVAVEAGDPPTPARGNIEVTDSGLDVRRDVVPIKLRIFIDDVGRRLVAELPVQTNLFKFVVKRIGFSQIVRIAKL